MPIPLLISAALALDAWDIKPPAAKSQWSISADASAGGESHAATFDLSETPKDGGTATAPAVHLEIANLMADTNPLPGASVDAVVNVQNALQSTSDDDGNRRMFTPLLFVYPSVPVNLGDTWKADVTPTAKEAQKVHLSFTAKAVEQVDGSDALQVTSTVKEDGDNNLSADGTWWVDKAGKIVKFKVTVKNWYVTMANGASVDGTLTGKLKKD
jgi:hypothetical protein